MNLKTEDFSYECNSQGYIILYKGQSIGGAGSFERQPRDPPAHTLRTGSHVALLKRLPSRDYEHIIKRRDNK